MTINTIIANTMSIHTVVVKPNLYFIAVKLLDVR